MNYTVITDPDKLKEFITWLPEIENDECYYVTLFGRTKYCTGEVKLKQDKQQLKSFTSNKDFLFEKIEQLEIKEGKYYQNHVSVPQESLSLYIMPNPRSNTKAAKNLIKELLDFLFTNNKSFNLHKKALTSLQTTSSRTVYMDFDFDHCTIDERKSDILKAVNESAVTFVQTRGGFHCLVEVEKVESEYKKSYYNNISKLDGCDVRGDNLLPIPGTFQGGFTPIFVK